MLFLLLIVLISVLVTMNTNCYNLPYKTETTITFDHDLGSRSLDNQTCFQDEDSTDNEDVIGNDHSP
jgi:hypothetical protein